MPHPENTLNALPTAVAAQTILDAIPPAAGRPQRILDASPIGNPLPLNVRDAQETVAGQLPDIELDALPLGQNPYTQDVRPDRNNSAGLPGIDWSCSAGGTNGEAMTDDTGPDLGFSTYIRRTGNLGSSTTYGDNLTLALVTANLTGWVFFFTTRTAFVGTNCIMFIHLRSDANPIITRSIAGPNHIGARDFTASALGNQFSFVLTNAEAANLHFAQQPWHVSTDFSGLDEAKTWDFSQFQLVVPAP